MQAAEFLAQALFLEAGNAAVATEVDTPCLLPGCLACVPAALSLSPSLPPSLSAPASGVIAAQFALRFPVVVQLLNTVRSSTPRHGMAWHRMSLRDRLTDCTNVCWVEAGTWGRAGGGRGTGEGRRRKGMLSPLAMYEPAVQRFPRCQHSMSQQLCTSMLSSQASNQSINPSSILSPCCHPALRLSPRTCASR